MVAAYKFVRLLACRCMLIMCWMCMRAAAGNYLNYHELVYCHTKLHRC